MKPLIELLQSNPNDLTTSEEDITLKKFETAMVNTMTHLRNQGIEMDHVVLMETLAVGIDQFNNTEVAKVIIQ